MSNGDAHTATGAGPAQSIRDLTHTFALSSGPNADSVLYDIPETLANDFGRQRRIHRKSKNGCANCRQRRVKCDESFPCARCTRRGDQCQRLWPCNGGRVAQGPRSMPAPSINTRLESDDSVVNLQHLKLFHHFQTRTRQTLLYPAEAWDRALQLSFEFEFLTNAILCVAARHLAFLQPQDSAYAPAAAAHLFRALTGFRAELSHDLTSRHLDVFIATSTLIQFELWTNIDLSSPLDPSTSDPSKDSIFAFCSSFKKVFIKSFPAPSIHSSIFMKDIKQKNAEEPIFTATRIGKATIARYRDLFAYHRPLTLQMLELFAPYDRGVEGAITNISQHLSSVMEVQDAQPNGYAPVVDHLCVILSFLPEAEPPLVISGKSLEQLARCILQFPIKCHGLFADMIYRGDEHALLLLYHFYRAVRILLVPSVYWWARNRSVVMEQALRVWLIERCEDARDELPEQGQAQL